MIGGKYFDLEQEADRLRLDLDWEQVVAGSELAILDEAQEFPEIFPRLRGAIDGDRDRTGRFLLLGSIAPGLMHRVSESLAGRLAIVHLSPLSLRELPEPDLELAWMVGGFPGSGTIHPERFPQWHRDYLALLSQRDLPNWGLPARPQMTDRLIRMTAASNGHLQNVSQLASSLGISAPTATQYLDFLEGVFLIRRLPAYSANLRKRLVKSPRLYWRDPGLLHAALGITTREGLLAQPWVGASWEGFVLEQILTTLDQLDRPHQAHHFRTSDRHELDLVLELGVERWAIETKLTSNPSRGDHERLRKTAELIEAGKRVLISRTTEEIFSDRDISCSLPAFIEHLAGS
jgi:predicted AAA+ superfamily ATPase